MQVVEIFVNVEEIVWLKREILVGLFPNLPLCVVFFKLVVFGCLFSGYLVIDC